MDLLTFLGVLACIGLVVGAAINRISWVQAAIGVVAIVVLMAIFGLIDID